MPPRTRPRHSTWKAAPRQLLAREGVGVHAPYDVRLCTGVFGAFENASALRARECHARAVRGLTVLQLRTRSDTGKPLAADLVLPRGVGSYDVRQITVNGVEPTYIATSAGGVIEVRGP